MQALLGSPPGGRVLATVAALQGQMLSTPRRSQREWCSQVAPPGCGQRRPICLQSVAPLVPAMTCRYWRWPESSRAGLPRCRAGGRQPP